MQAAIAYYRVSTKRQGVSGLGLEAQQQSVHRYAAARDLAIIEEFTEIETGTNKRQRSEIGRALAAAARQGALLLIARLDRLARNVHFISGLMQSGVQFVAVDMPNVNELTINILAAVAQEEARLISERTRAALAVAKQRGVVLGKPENLTEEAQRRGARANRRKAVEAYRPVAGYARLLQEQGMSYRAIAGRLNEEGHTTRTGKAFRGMTVKRILDRVA